MSDATNPTPEERARVACHQIEQGMRRMGVVTTAHYDAGLTLIADAIRDALSAAVLGERRAWAEAVLASAGNDGLTAEMVALAREVLSRPAP